MNGLALYRGIRALPRGDCKTLAGQMSAQDFSLQMEKADLTDSCGIENFGRVKFE